MLKWAYVLLAIGAAIAMLFAASFFGELGWPFALMLGGLAALPLVLFTAALVAAVRLFGSPAVGPPALVGTLALLLWGIFLYSTALSPDRFIGAEFNDGDELILLVEFAPLYLAIGAVILSAATLIWGWRRRRARAV